MKLHPDKEWIYNHLDQVSSGWRGSVPVVGGGSAVVRELLREFKRRGSNGGNGGRGGERGIAANRDAQRKLEEWVRTEGIFLIDDGTGTPVFDKNIHRVEDRTAKGGFDFFVHLGVDPTNDNPIGLVDAKSACETTRAQDRQLEGAWKKGDIKCYLVNYDWMKPLLPTSDRESNGSRWL